MSLSHLSIAIASALPKEIVSQPPIVSTTQGYKAEFKLDTGLLPEVSAPTAGSRVMIRDGNDYSELPAAYLSSVPNGVTAGTYAPLKATIDAAGRVSDASNLSLLPVTVDQIANLSTDDQARLFEGSLVSVTSNSTVYAYKGAGSKTDVLSYQIVADNRPTDWAQVTNKPAVILANGSIAMTGALNAGSQKITSLAAGTAAGDAVNKTQLDAVASAVGGVFGNRTLAAAANLTGRDSVTLLGRVVAFDCDQHTYRRLASAPSTPTAAYHFQDSTGAWFELYGDIYEPEVFGAISDGTTNCTSAILAAREYFRARGGGWLKMRNEERGAYLLANDVNFNASGLRVEAPAGRFRINRTTLMEDEGVLGIRKTAGVPLSNVRIGDFVIYHTDNRELTFASPTVGQTAFNIAALAPRNGFDLIVYRSTAALAVTKKVNFQSGEFTTTATTLTLTTPITAGEQLRVKRISASAASCGVYMQGVSQTEMLEGCSVGNIEIYSDGSLYIGRIALWTRRCKFGTAIIQGVDNRASYSYGAQDRLVMGDLFVNGGAFSGVFANTALCLTDYTLDLNKWDAATQAETDCIYGKVKAQKVFRGVSVVGQIFRATFDTIDCLNVESYSLLVQDTAAAGESAFLHFPRLATATNRNHAIWVMCSHISLGGYLVNGLSTGAYGIYLSAGNVSSAQVRNQIGAGQIIATGGAGAAYFKDQFYLDVLGLKAAGGGVTLDGVQYATVNAQVDSFAGTGLDVLGNCFRINADANISGCTVGVRLNTSSQIHTIKGIANSNTTNLVNNATNTNLAALLVI